MFFLSLELNVTVDDYVDTLWSESSHTRCHRVLLCLAYNIFLVLYT